MKTKGSLFLVGLVFILMASTVEAQHAGFRAGIAPPAMVSSPVQPFVTSPVQPFVSSPVQPFVTSPVQPFVMSPVAPMGVPQIVPIHVTPIFINSPASPAFVSNPNPDLFRPPGVVDPRIHVPSDEVGFTTVMGVPIRNH
jgi:hypothetical protein